MAYSNPLVSIGLPVYNGAQFLSLSLDSLLSQDYDHFELIITDNASTDITPEICRHYAEKDRRILYHRNQENIGLFGNFNRAFALSKGDYFMWAGAHDLWDKNFVSCCLRKLADHPDLVLCTGEYREIDTQGTFVKIIPVYVETRGMSNAERLHWSMSNPGSCFASYSLIRASALRKTRLFVDKFAGDYLFVAELSLLGEFSTTPETKIYMRAFPDRSFSPEENVERILSRTFSKTLNAAMMRRFPISQHRLEMLRLLRRAPIGPQEKLRLTLDLLRQSVKPLLREFGLNLMPRSAREALRRVFS